MSGYRVTELLQSRGDPDAQYALTRGYISGAVGPNETLIAAPATFPVANSRENLLWVVVPEYSTVRPIGPCAWNADHGTNLPAQFAPCVIGFDNEELPTVLWWQADTDFATESGGEGLAGLYVGPTAPKPPTGSGSYLWFETNAGETEVLELRLGKA
jgi:hypothetical protein